MVSAVPVSQIILIIAAGLLAARIGKHFRVPESIPLMITGYALGSGWLGFLKPEELGINLDFLALIAVPIILFYDGLKTEARSLAENAGSVISISTVAVFATVAGIAFFSNLFLGLSWLSSFLLGAILASTDPAAILPVLRKLNIKKRIATVLEAETALNDGAAITIFTVVLGLAAGQEIGLRQGLQSFLYLAISSTLLGAMVGFAFFELFKRMKIEDDLLFASFVVLLTAYGVAEFFAASAVITIVIAALIFRAFVQSVFVTASNRIHTLSVWDDLNSLAISAVFLVLGSQVKLHEVLPFLLVGVLISLAFMLVVRPITVYASMFFDKSFKLREKMTISWLGGPRGVVSAALAGIVLARASEGLMPAEEAKAIFNITIIVIVTTIGITSVSASKVAKYLLKIREDTIEDEYKRLSTELKTMMVASRRFREEWKEGVVSTKIYDALNKEMTRQMRRIEKKLGEITKRAPLLETKEIAVKAREIILNQIAALENAYENKEITEKEYSRLLNKFRAQIDTLGEIEKD